MSWEPGHDQTQVKGPSQFDRRNARDAATRIMQGEDLGVLKFHPLRSAQTPHHVADLIEERLHRLGYTVSIQHVTVDGWRGLEVRRTSMPGRAPKRWQPWKLEE